MPSRLRRDPPKRPSIARVGGGLLVSGRVRGTVVTAVGLVSATVSFAASESAEQGRVDPTVALNAPPQEAWIPITGGLAAMFLATGIGAFRSGGLPGVLGWRAIGLGAAFVTPAGLVAFFLTPLWIVATSIVLIRSSHHSAPVAKTPRVARSVR